MSKLIQIVGRTKYGLVGVLETPCFPCTYYGYFIEEFQNQWHTTDNAASNYYRTKEAALTSARELLKRLENKENNNERRIEERT